MSDVYFEEYSGRGGNLGIITLNRPQVLNALNQSMFLAINQQLTEWEDANHIKAVIIRAGEGRAFCAGGDIRSAYELKKSDENALSTFFRDEYLLNKHIHHYKKPYIALMNGITMGGGAGISIHGSHRLATENFIFCHARNKYWLLSRCSGTFFLSRLPYKMGIYLGLTGARITAADCLTLGLIDCLVKSENFSEIIYTIADTDLQPNPKVTISGILEKFFVKAPTANLFEKHLLIADCFAKNTVEEIIHSLQQNHESWCQQTAAILHQKSPTSLKVTLAALQRAVHLDFNQCMQNEMGLTNCFIKGHDFFEGIRAVVIDKDQQPRWKPASLQEVTAADVEHYFSSQFQSPL